ncbi:nucleotide-diphosphate-sugar epimerase [Actinocatenispora thailandica]|uniref:Nucleotide-diphosphate-sugar epimerase n=1 Tax=Actinocatenispora thailandica TaxID=227318 RepID=A0A7R7DL63_9ACTN|nr:NAD(P)H-binding protein [Actinocatenispora thailandica]BCJ33377.1 nucleotide-diphosphate-sugar epimerase [Actinocatenispora thailandica]
MILVTGATGVVGHPLVELLVSAGAEVRAVSRDPEAANLPAGVEVVRADPSRPTTLDGALHGVTAMFVNPRTVGTAAAELLDRARDAGVRRVVSMSALNVDFDLDRQPSRLRGEYNKEVEAAVAASGLEWFALRSGFYAVNTIGMWAGQIRAGDVVRGPYADTSWAPLHERDIAAVGAHALLADELSPGCPVLTGPRALTQTEMVETIGAAIGRPLRFEEVPVEVAKRGMVASGIPAALADGFMAMQADSYGQAGLVTGEVDRILGRPGLDFAAWAADHTADFQQ